LSSITSGALMHVRAEHHCLTVALDSHSISFNLQQTPVFAPTQTAVRKIVAVKEPYAEICPNLQSAVTTRSAAQGNLHTKLELPAAYEEALREALTHPLQGGEGAGGQRRQSTGEQLLCEIAPMSSKGMRP